MVPVFQREEWGRARVGRPAATPGPRTPPDGNRPGSALPSDVFRGLGCRPGSVELSAPGGEGAVFEGFDQPVGPGDGVFLRGGVLPVDASLPDVTLG